MSAATRIGVACLARPTFDVALAAEVATSAWERLGDLGAELVGTPDLILDGDALAGTVAALGAEDLDALVVVQATFADATLAASVAEANPASLLLWALPEPRTGGRLRLNSLCGVNLAGYRLTRAGRRYRYLYQHPADPGSARALAHLLTAPLPDLPVVAEPPDPVRCAPDALAAATAVVDRLARTTIGVVGDHPVGFDPCAYDPEALAAAVGVRAEAAPLTELFARAEAVPASAAAADRQRAAGTLAGIDELDQGALDRSLRLHLGLADLVAERDWSAVATRCWPECFTEFGGACCTPQAMLNDDGVPGCCEADAYGAVTSLVLQWLGGGAAFVADLVDLDPADGTGVLWHCGLAPVAMAHPGEAPRATVHSNRRLPLLNEFALRPGRVTLARLSQSRHRMRLTIGGGEMLARPLPFAGTAGVIRFDRPVATVLDTVMSEGHEHHYGIVYGDVRAELTALAGLLSLPVIEL